MLVMLGILFLIAFISALRTVLVAKLVISVILPSIFLITAFNRNFSILTFPNNALY